MSNILSKFCSIRNFSFWYSEDYWSIFSVESCTEKLTYKWSDLLWREVHHSDYLLSYECFFAVVIRNLGTWLLDSDFSSEIYPDLIGTFASLWEIFCTYYGTDTEFHGFKFRPSESFHNKSIEKIAVYAKKSYFLFTFCISECTMVL